MNDLIQYAQSIIVYLEQNGANLNVESQLALGELLQNVLQIIEQEGEEEGPTGDLGPTGGQQPDLEQSMPSSNIDAFGYDEDTGRLLVRFLGKYPDRNGPIYGYEGVPPNIFEIFRKGAIPAKTDGKNKWGQWWKGKYPSIGAAMYHVIRSGGYPYERLS